MPNENKLLSDLLSDIEYSAKLAVDAGPAGAALAGDLEEVVARYRNGNPAPAQTGAAPAIDHTQAIPVQSAVPASPPVGDEVRVVHGNEGVGAYVGEDYDDYDDEDYDEDFDQGPQELTLTVRRLDGFPLTLEDGRAAIEIVLPSIHEVSGQFDITDVVHPDEDEPDTVQVTLTLDEDAPMPEDGGAGWNGFHVPLLPLVGVGDVEISSPGAARHAGGDGTDEDGHPVNRALALREDEDGVAPRAEPDFTVTYRRLDGYPLTREQVDTIVEHPISKAGLAQFGQATLLDVRDGTDQSEKKAVFRLVSPGHINLATMAAQVDLTRYTGTVNFGPGIGRVHAQGEAYLVEDASDAA